MKNHTRTLAVLLAIVIAASNVAVAAYVQPNSPAAQHGNAFLPGDAADEVAAQEMAKKKKKKKKKKKSYSS
jgi:hypothetical protein